jgi:hypothetical protein
MQEIAANFARNADRLCKSRPFITHGSGVRLVCKITFEKRDYRNHIVLGALVGAERAGLLGRHAGARSARHLLSRAQERQNRTRTRPRRVRCQWSEPPHFRHLGRMSVLALIPTSPRYVGNRRSVPNSDIETTLNLTLQYPRIFGATVA